MLTLPLIEGWGEDKAWLTSLVRPHMQRELHGKAVKRANPFLRFGFSPPTPPSEARKM